MDQDVIADIDVDDRVRDYFSGMSDAQYRQLQGLELEQELDKVFREIVQRQTKRAGTKRKALNDQPLDTGEGEEVLDEHDQAQVNEQAPDEEDGEDPDEQAPDEMNQDEGVMTIDDDDTFNNSQVNGISVGDQMDEQQFEKMLETFEQIDLRSYQEEMVNIALKQNTIVHLATGTGKTMIAMTLIHKLSAAFQQEPPKQTIFLVPSVVLAIQQGQTLTNNLPFSIGLAYGGKATNQEAIANLAKSNIVVATHGTLLNMIQHHGFDFNRCNLLIIDECHNCVGSSLYAQIMESHSRNETERPRIVGLTASPLLSVKKNHSDEQIENMLDKLEASLDSRIVSIGQHNASIDVDDDEFEILFGDVEEREVFYGGYNHKRPSEGMPLAHGIHERRMKDFASYGDILDTLGPLPLQLMAQSLLGSISVCSYERESEEEYANARQFLEDCIGYCQRQQSECPIAGKLRVLSSLLRTELSSDASTVGVVFVERRLTAFALNLYFNHLQQNHSTSSTPNISALKGDPDSCNTFGQFMDADDDLDPSTKTFSGECGHDNEVSLVRSAYLVRSAHQKRMPKQDGDGQKGSTEGIIQKFHDGIINCLICTSVAEEGLDIQSCSFAIAFDGITSSKRYVQMKGRVRHRQGKFFLMTRNTPQAFPETDTALKLSDLGDIARRVNSAILRRSRQSRSLAFRVAPLFADLPVSQPLDDYSADWKHELQAATNGIYRTECGEVSQFSAKSLLYRFYLCQTMEKTDRHFRENIQGKLPLFSSSLNSFFLILPGHIEPSLRRVTLPDEFAGESRRKRECILSLMACVRLHRHGLLSDQLLPLTQKNILEKVTKMLESQQVDTPIPEKPVKSSDSFYVYKIILGGNLEFQRTRELLKSSISLAVIAKYQVNDLPIYTHQHVRFGELVSKLQPLDKISLSDCDVSSLTEFFATIMNARWSKRNGNTRLRPCSDEDVLVAIVDEKGSPNFALMKDIVHEGDRTEDLRMDAVLKASLANKSALKPRLWTKRIQPSPVYVAHHHADNNLSDTNAPEQEFVCSLVWKAPRAIFKCRNGQKGLSDCDVDYLNGLSDSTVITCQPSDCIECPFVSDPGLLLETILLPQVLYLVERQLVAQHFLEHCTNNFPLLAEALKGIGWRKIRQLLTSVRSEMPETYERFEWLGDAVVKLLVTQLCNEKNEIATWIQNFHEGNLSELRSVVVSNNWLAKVCTNAHFDKFLFINALEQKTWRPSSLDKYDFRTNQPICNNRSPSLKTCADFVEGLMGSLFHSYGFEKARKIAIEIHAVPESESSSLQHFSVTTQEDTPDSSDAQLFRRIEGAVGITPCSNLKIYKQAFCHTSNLDEQMKSNEILEWIGDAVLTVAIRSWIFDRFNGGPGDLTLIESSIVSNGTLAFIAVYHDLHHLIMHQDETLPQRINDYTNTLADARMSTLWTTNAPKAVADLVEALLGSVYLDRGLEQGTKAVHHCLAPVLRYFTKNGGKVIEQLGHPKSQLKALVGNLFSFTWTSGSAKAGVEIAVEGRSVGFVPGDDSVSTQVLAAAVALRALQRNSFLKEKLREIRTFAGDH